MKKKDMTDAEYLQDALDAQDREARRVSGKSQTTGLNLATSIAEELCCDFSILNHDGNLLKGEHYWVGLEELTDYIADCIERNPNV